MTVEQITVITPSDLIAMRVACTKCQASLSLQLNQTIRVPDECPVCSTPWREQRSMGAPTEAERLGNAIKAWLEAERQKQPNFSLKFEIPHL